MSEDFTCPECGARQIEAERRVAELEAWVREWMAEIRAAVEKLAGVKLQ